MDTGTGAKVAQKQEQQHVRASERFDLEVKVDLESDHNFYTGLTQNISAGGLFIATSALNRVDGATGMGVRFVNLSPEAAKAIQDFIQSRDSLYYDDE